MLSTAKLLSKIRLWLGIPSWYCYKEWHWSYYTDRIRSAKGSIVPYVESSKYNENYL